MKKNYCAKWLIQSINNHWTGGRGPSLHRIIVYDMSLSQTVSVWRDCSITDIISQYIYTIRVTELTPVSAWAVQVYLVYTACHIHPPYIPYINQTTDSSTYPGIRLCQAPARIFTLFAYIYIRERMSDRGRENWSEIMNMGRRRINEWMKNRRRDRTGKGYEREWMNKKQNREWETENRESKWE